MENYRFTLEAYKGPSTRFTCPSCEHRQRTFTRYIDTHTGHYINPEVGRCNRENNCGYHYTPRKFFEDHGKGRIDIYTKPKDHDYSRDFETIDFTMFKNSLSNYEENDFIKFLMHRFGEKSTTKLIENYFIGTSGHWPGATIFWQIDRNGKIRSGKVMSYNPQTGKRYKEKITWVHRTEKLKDFQLKQCLFGEHLLCNNLKPVALVESEKTAVIASLYLPQFTWLAVGSLNELKLEKCLSLHDQKVTLFPDLNAYENWRIKSSELSRVLTINVSKLLEANASDEDRNMGLDIADYLLKFDHKKFSNDIGVLDNNYLTNLHYEGNILMADGYPASWDLQASYLDLGTRRQLKEILYNHSLHQNAS